jgi:hypothetical protein
MMNDRRAGFALFAVLAGGAAAVVWFGLPHEREITSLWIFLLKLVPFVFAVEAIAWFEPKWIRSAAVAMVTILLTFAVYFLFFVPKIFFHSDDFPTLYYHVLTLTPFIILSLTFAYRLGGGAAGTCRRLAYAMLLVMLSGAEDLAFLTVNPHTDPRFTPIPEVWTWASHITIFLGHPPHKTEAYVFIAVHLVLAALVLTVPWRWLGRGESARAAARSAPVAEESS